MNDPKSPDRASSSGEPVGDATELVRVRHVESAGPGEQGSGLQRATSLAQERAEFEKAWPSAAIYEPEELSEYTRMSVYNDAIRAVKFGQTVEEACPHPWFTPSGKLWRKVHRAAVEAKQ